MKFTERISWGRRAVVELRGIRRALEGIGSLLAASIAPDIAQRSAFRSFYQGDSKVDPKEDLLSYLDDDDRAEMERQDLEEKARGGPAVEGFYGDEGAGSVVGPTVAEEEDA